MNNTVEAPQSPNVKYINYWELTAFEAVTMSVVGVLAVTLGVLLGTLGGIA